MTTLPSSSTHAKSRNLLPRTNLQRLAKRKVAVRVRRGAGGLTLRSSSGHWARLAEPRILTVLQAKFRKGKQVVAKTGLLIFVSGPSGVWKSTVCRRLASELPAEFAVSATTRAGKPQDAQGKQYEFVDE